MFKKIFISVFILLGGALISAILYERYKIKEFINLIDSDPYYIVDETTGHAHAPNYEFSYAWPESDSIKKQTNNLGFVEARATLVNKDDNTFRIIITGDSHIDGVVNTDQTFPGVLETELGKSPNIKATEVINAGVGFYSFQNYNGVIKKYGYLKPDLFVVSVYSGNDFIEGYLYDTESQKALPSLQTFWYRLAKGFFQLRTKMASTQSTNQILFFKIFPEKKEKALAIAEKQLLEIRKRCEENQTKLLVVLLPSKLESEKAFREKVIGLSGWSESESNINRELSSNLKDWLKEKKINFIDPTTQFETAGEKLFWDTDQHLNKAGHSLLAKIVLESQDWKNLNLQPLTNNPNGVKAN